jgi:hypothetical protein
MYTNSHASPAVGMPTAGPAPDPGTLPGGVGVLPPASAPSDAQHGILPRYGATLRPREGGMLGVLSTGFAREFDDANGTSAAFKGIKRAMQAGEAPPGSLPPGFPLSAAGCPSQAAAAVHDVVIARLALKAPRNARGFSFDFNFWSSEWPEYVCSNFNDAFVAYVTTSAGEGNVSFDAQADPVSVNNGFFDRCTPDSATGCLGGSLRTAACPGGTDELQGTGFFDLGSFCSGKTTTGGGATGWLTSHAPVTPGDTVTIEFVLYDVGDPNYDSVVLLDNFRWIPGRVDAPSTARADGIR